MMGIWAGLGRGAAPAALRRGGRPPEPPAGHAGCPSASLGPTPGGPGGRGERRSPATPTAQQLPRSRHQRASLSPLSIHHSSGTSARRRARRESISCHEQLAFSFSSRKTSPPRSSRATSRPASSSVRRQERRFSRPIRVPRLLASKSTPVPFVGQRPCRFLPFFIPLAQERV